MIPFKILLVLLFFAFSLGFLTKPEAEHVGFEYPTPDIIKEFENQLKYSKSSVRASNDIIEHHALVEKFCYKYLYKKRNYKCSWKEYYTLLLHVREPYSRLYDPGARIGFDIENLFVPSEKNQFSEVLSCDEFAVTDGNDGSIPVMTSDVFMRYVVASRPFVIRNYASNWDAVNSKSESKWSVNNLKKHAGDQQVVVSVSPSAEFDGPESSDMWDPEHIVLDPAEDPVVIARPAHLQFSIGEYMDLITSPKYQHTRKNASMYLEYFPLYAVGKKSTKTRSSIDMKTGTKSKSSKKVKNNKKKFKTSYTESFLQKSIPSIPWSEVLSLHYQLLWLGGGGVKGRGVEKNVGKMHFDRNENIMVMFSGSKNFTLYNPLQSAYLYGDFPIYQGNIGVDWDKATGKISFSRSVSKEPPYSFSQQKNVMHTYSPVDINNPDLETFPLFKHAKGFDCVINEV